MWLPWKAALALAAALAIVPFLVVVGLFAKPSHRGVQYALAFARETAVVLGLYALWQFAGTLSLLHVDGAIAAGDWIFDLAAATCTCPSELTVQHAVLHSSLLVQALNVFYATMHFPGMIAFLIWMFVRHRDRYPQVRNTMVLVTGAALAIQLIPVAPPRLTPGPRLRRHADAVPPVGVRAGRDRPGPTSCRRCRRCTLRGRCSSRSACSCSPPAAAAG